MFFFFFSLLKALKLLQKWRNYTVRKQAGAEVPALLAGSRSLPQLANNQIKQHLLIALSLQNPFIP